VSSLSPGQQAKQLRRAQLAQRLSRRHRLSKAIADLVSIRLALRQVADHVPADLQLGNMLAPDLFDELADAIHHWTSLLAQEVRDVD
jgi:hypothetical protein